MIRPALVATLCTVLGACSAITGPRSQFTVFTLNPPPAQPAADTVASVDWQLAIDEPHALGLLASDRLVVAPDANERLAFAGARWNESAPALLQDLWLRTFEADGRIGAVVRHPSGTLAQRVLATDLVAFQIEHHGSQSEAVIAVQARLVDAGSRRNLAQAPFRSRVAVRDDSAQAAVQALEAATAELSTQLLAWTIREGERTATP